MIACNEHVSTNKYRKIGDSCMEQIQKMVKKHCDSFAGVGVGLTVGLLISLLILLMVVK